MGQNAPVSQELGMSPLTYALLVMLAAAVVYGMYRLAAAFLVYLKFRGKRLVTCPETKQAAAVEVAASGVAIRAVAGVPHLRLSDCSRWPERENCGQDCLSQVEADPEKCLVWNIVNSWYAGKTCVYCNKPFGKINWHDHRPALLDANRKSVQWTDVPPARLPEVFASHWPVCWDCHIAESFRREHSDMVVDRQRR